jgi:hypothetical protein
LINFTADMISVQLTPSAAAAIAKDSNMPLEVGVKDPKLALLPLAAIEEPSYQSLERIMYRPPYHPAATRTVDHDTGWVLDQLPTATAPRPPGQISNKKTKAVERIAAAASPAAAAAAAAAAAGEGQLVAGTAAATAGIKHSLASASAGAGGRAVEPIKPADHTITITQPHQSDAPQLLRQSAIPPVTFAPSTSNGSRLPDLTAAAAASIGAQIAVKQELHTEEKRLGREASLNRSVKRSPASPDGHTAAPTVITTEAAAVAAGVALLPSRVAELLQQVSDVGLSAGERDELRSVVLLHIVAAAAEASSPGLFDRHGERIHLELACEPEYVMTAVVPVEQLWLPAFLMPSNCSVGRFARSHRCSLLEKAGKGLVKASFDCPITALCGQPTLLCF